MTAYKRWGDFAVESPDLVEVGHRLLYQGSAIASAFLATVAPDQGPRVHPVFPVLALGDLWLFIVNLSPKYRDLCRNRWFALHTLPTAEGGEEFYLRGYADEVTDQTTKDSVVAATNGRQGSSDFEALFRCEPKSVLYTKWDNWGTAEAWPSYSKWQGTPQVETK
jgi:hypothetical protein